jgi:hypothetical protein
VSQIFTAVRLALMIAVVGTVSACVAPARMVPEQTLLPSDSLDSPFREAIVISKVGGGERMSFLFIPKVGNDELKEALRLSLEQDGFLSTADTTAPFRLEAFLIELKQPSSGFTMIVYSLIRYKLTRSSDDQVVYDDIITASYRATMGDSWVGGQRMKIATERAIQANIAAFLKELHSLDIPPSPIQ